MVCIELPYVGHSFVAMNSGRCRNEFKNYVPDVYSKKILSKSALLTTFLVCG